MVEYNTCSFRSRGKWEKAVGSTAFSGFPLTSRCVNSDVFCSNPPGMYLILFPDIELNKKSNCNVLRICYVRKLLTGLAKILVSWLRLEFLLEGCRPVLWKAIRTNYELIVLKMLSASTYSILSEEILRKASSSTKVIWFLFKNLQIDQTLIFPLYLNLKFKCVSQMSPLMCRKIFVMSNWNLNGT